MTQTHEFIADGGPAEAHVFDGSSTCMVALQRWIDNGDFVPPKVATRDIRFGATIGGFDIKDGDYIVKEFDWFRMVTRDDFEANYRKHETQGDD